MVVYSNDIAHLFSVEHDMSVDDESPRLINAVGKTAAEDKDVDSALDGREHQTADRREVVLLLFLLVLVLLDLAAGVRMKGGLVVAAAAGLTTT